MVGRGRAWLVVVVVVVVVFVLELFLFYHYQTPERSPLDAQGLCLTSRNDAKALG